MYDNDPDLEDLLSDPLVRLVMASDGVEEAQIRKLAGRIALRQKIDGRLPGSRFGATGSELRHTPSCRAVRRDIPSTQPLA